VIIRIKNNQKKRNLAETKLRRVLATLLRRAGRPDAELSVVFVGDRAMRSLNRRYRGKDRTTDVLSFPMREGAYQDIQSHVLGDIVISIPTAEKQARAAGTAFPREIDRLLVHGLLHLLGYDHERSPTDEKTMRRMESLYLKRISS